MPLGVDRQQRLLHGILRLGCASPRLCAQTEAFVVTLAGAEQTLSSKGTVGSRVAVEAGNHQVL